MRWCIGGWKQRAVYVRHRGVAGGHESVRGKQCACEAQCSSGESSGPNSVARRGDAEQTRDSSNERAAVGGHGESGTLAPLFHKGKCTSVFDGIAADGERGVIAAIFAFGADAFVQPPDGRMIKEQGFGGDLKKINEAIEAANVGEFVRNDRGELIFRKATERGYWQENDGTEPADYGGSLEREAFAIANGAVNVHAALERVALFKKRSRDRAGAIAAHTPDDDQASGSAQAEEGDASEPGFDEPQKHVRTKRRRRGRKI